jgi:hypothetical protein
MSKQILLISFLGILVFGFIGCKKTTPAGCSAAWASELSEQAAAVSTAAQAYALDPTQENCLAYKAAYQAYIDALEPYGNCATLTGADRDAWQQAIDDARENVNNIDCS